jgi:hypothetical protein
MHVCLHVLPETTEPVQEKGRAPVSNGGIARHGFGVHTAVGGVHTPAAEQVAAVAPDER